ncbi:hypothetical protein CHRY9293_00149 [Chryseobacterium potabilaquae]|uniref:Uncharacterized protein n=1 Tax=Chryseobacterium potabilaquae TaxID=2675057 RepID=A0A6N4X0N5_9FLAO|nr:hypothetical protein CHRY9293_00149 [Chryseobacterium potabilaquae]
MRNTVIKMYKTTEGFLISTTYKVKLTVYHVFNRIADNLKRYR